MATLNVILHGLYAIHERQNDLLLFLPLVDHIHVFRAGAWLAETELQPDVIHSLTGVTTGSAKFDRSRNLVVPKQPFPGSAVPGAFTTITLPTPAAIHSLRLAEMAPGELGGGDMSRVTSKHFATVQVLVYDVADMTAVRLESHAWQASSDPAATVQNLHILSEEEIGDDEHSLDAFRESASLLGLDLELMVPKLAPEFDPKHDVLPAGVHPMELEDLSFRLGRLQEYGELLRTLLSQTTTADPATLAEAFVRPWGGFVPSGSRVGSCSSLISSEF